MTIPIAERLRDTAQHCSSWGIDLDIPPYAMWADLMDEAANVLDDLMDEVQQAQAEVERLRKIIAAAYYADTDSAVALLEEEVRR